MSTAPRELIQEHQLSITRYTTTLALSGALATFVGFGFVASLYAVVRYSAESETLQTKDRNHPDIIKRRLGAGSMDSVQSVRSASAPSPMLWGCNFYRGIKFPNVQRRSDERTRGDVFCLGFIVLLFLGPIVEHFACRCYYQDSNHEAGRGIFLRSVWKTAFGPNANMIFRRFREKYCDLQHLRDLVAAPVYEELVYRVCVCGILRNAGSWRALTDEQRGPSPFDSKNSGGTSTADGTILPQGQEQNPQVHSVAGFPDWVIHYLSPMLFGLSHIHHHYKNKDMLLPLLFQLFYTTVFGILETFLYSQSGFSVLGIILVHAFCNFMGFPRFWCVLAGSVESWRPSGTQAHLRSVPGSATFLGLRLACLLAYVAGVYLAAQWYNSRAGIS